jgi:hypothetical protein
VKENFSKLSGPITATVTYPLNKLQPTNSTLPGKYEKEKFKGENACS